MGLNVVTNEESFSRYACATQLLMDRFASQTQTLDMNGSKWHLQRAALLATVAIFFK